MIAGGFGVRSAEFAFGRVGRKNAGKMPALLVPNWKTVSVAGVTKASGEPAHSKLLRVADGNAIVAIEDYVFEEGGYAVPSRSGGWFEALHAGGRRDHDIASSHRAAH